MNIKAAVDSEFSNPKHAGGYIAPLVVSQVQKRIAAIYHTKLKLNNSDLEVFDRLAGEGAIVSDEQKDHDHPRSRVIADYLLDKDLLPILQNYSKPLLIGSTYSQHAYIQSKLPQAVVTSVIGTFGARDWTRQTRCLAKAKKQRASTDASEVAIAEKYIEWYTTRLPNPYFLSPDDEFPESDVVVAIDCLYDIHPATFAEYLAKAAGRANTIVYYATMHVVPDVLYCSSARVPDLEMEWSSSDVTMNYKFSMNDFRDKVMMRHSSHHPGRGRGLGYVHDKQTCAAWWLNSIFVENTKRKGTICFTKETLKSFSSYELLEGSVTLSSYWNIQRSLNDSAGNYIELWDICSFLLFREKIPFLLEKKKGEAIFHFAIRLIGDNFEPTKVASYMVNLMSRMVVNGKEIQSQWDIDSFISLKALLWYCTYAAISRGMMFKAVSRAIRASQAKEGGTYSYWIVGRLRKIWYFITGKTRRVLLTEMQKCLTVVPRSAHEWHNESRWNFTTHPVLYSESTAEEFYEKTNPDVKKLPFWQRFKRSLGLGSGNEEAEMNEMENEPEVKQVPVFPSNDDYKNAVMDLLLRFPPAPPPEPTVQEQIREEQKIEFHRSMILQAQRIADERSVELAMEAIPLPVEEPEEPDVSWGYLGTGFYNPFVVTLPQQKLDLLDIDSVLGAIDPLENASAPPVDVPPPPIWEEIQVKVPTSPIKLVEELPVNLPFILTPLPEQKEAILPEPFTAPPLQPDVNAQNCNDPEVPVLKRKTSVPKLHLEARTPDAEGNWPKIPDDEVAENTAQFVWSRSAVPGQSRIPLSACREAFLNRKLVKLVPPNPQMKLASQFKMFGKHFCKGRSFLDVGGGTGDLAKALAKQYPEMSRCLDPLCEHIEYSFKLKMEEYGGAPADVVLCNMSLHHIKSWWEHLPKLVASGGTVIIREHDLTKSSVYALDYIHNCYGDDLGEANYMTYNFLFNKMRSLGFDLLSKEEGHSLGEYISVWVHPAKKEFGSLKIPQAKAEELLRAYQTNAFMTTAKADYDNYQELHKQVDDTLKNITPLSDYQSCAIKVWAMTAGAGKTSRAIREFDPRCDFYICHSQELLVKWWKDLVAASKVSPAAVRGTHSKTFEKALADTFLPKARRIYLDEFTQYPISYQIALMTLAPKAKIICMGDFAQSEWNWEGFFVDDQRASNYKDCYTVVETEDRTFRFPESHCSFLRNSPLKSKIYAHPNSKRKDAKFSLGVIPYGQEPKGAFNIVLSSLGLQMLANDGISARTVRAAQGSDASVVNFYISPHCRHLVDQHNLMFVAFTRASDYLNVIYLPGAENTLAMKGWQIPNLQMLTEQALNIPIPAYDCIPIFSKGLYDTLEPEPAKVAFDVAKLVSLVYGIPGDLKNLQEAYTSVLDDEVFKQVWTFRADKLPEQVWVTERRLSGSAWGKIFKHASPKQNLCTLLKRNCAGLESLKYDKVVIPDWSKFTERFWKLFTEKSFDLTDVTEKLVQSLVALYKKYIAKFKCDRLDLGSTDLEIFSPGLRPMDCIIKGHLKDISKVRGMEAAWLEKHGQEIGAWNTNANGAFCAYFRTVTQMMVERLKPQFIYGANKSDEEIAALLSEMPKHKHKICKDWEFYDVKMNKLTQELESRTAEQVFRMDSRELFDQLCMHMREVTPFASIERLRSKSSGRPDTFPFNTFDGMIFDSLMIPSMVGGIWGGDDDCVCTEDEEMEANIALYQGLKLVQQIFPSSFKLQSSPLPEFCGHIWCKDQYFYDPNRIAVKILCRRYSNEKSFLEYQTSVRDLIKPYFACPAVARMAAVYHSTSAEHMTALYEELHAFATCNPWKDFSKCLDHYLVTY